MKIANRIYADYLMPSRLAEYESMIAKALDLGYRHLTIPEFYTLVLKGETDTAGKVFIHRHDIDTDVKTAARLFDIERRHGIKTSYYFRLSTWHTDLAVKIQKYGSEVGYHYEELAQYCKDYPGKAGEVKMHYPAIRELFLKNLQMIERKAGFKIKTIASHGDFVNRKLSISNYDFITEELMRQGGIELECYDRKLLSAYQAILSDTTYPDYYKPVSPFQCMERGDRIIYLLTHPRHWHTAPMENTKDNITRLIQGIKYKLYA